MSGSDSEDGGSYSYRRRTWLFVVLYVLTIGPSVYVFTVGIQGTLRTVTQYAFGVGALVLPFYIYFDESRRRPRVATLAALFSAAGFLIPVALGYGGNEEFLGLGFSVNVFLFATTGAPPYVVYRIVAYRNTVRKAKRTLGRARSAISAGDQALEAGDFETASERYMEANGHARETLDLAVSDATGLPSTAETAREVLAEAERGAARADAAETVGEVEEILADAESAMDAGEYREATSMFKTAIARTTAVKTQAEEAGLSDLTDRLVDLRERAQEGREAAADELDRAEYEQALAEAEAAADRAAELFDDGEYAAAVDAYDDAIEAAESAVEIAEDGPENSERARDRVETYESRRGEALLSALGARLDAVPAEPDEEFDRHLDRVEGIAAEATEADLRQERERALLVEDTVGRAFEVAGTGARALIEAGATAFDDGEYDRARDAFEDGEALIRRALDLAEQYDVEADADVEELAETCERNADAARRAKLGLGEGTPDLRRPGDRPAASGTDSGSAVASGGVLTQVEADTEVFEGYPVPEAVPTAPEVDLSFADLDLGERIGTGGNADVFRATAATADGTVEVAVKQPRFQGTVDVDELQGFVEEAETWASIDDHPGIVGVVDWGNEPTPWIAMEYVDGGTLAALGETASLARRLWTAYRITEAVYHAHRRGIQHFDLKPGNVLLRTAGDAWPVPKVSDWGLARHLLDSSGTVEGFSPAYAAPEQLDPDTYGGTNERTDIYALGVVFYELFTGRPPFEGPRAAVIRSHLDEQPTPPSAVADVPGGLDEPLRTALAKAPADRFESVLYLRDALLAVAEETI